MRDELAIFIEYLCQCLVPTLRPGDIVIIDNLPAHKRQDVRELIEAAGAQLRYLPPYSPDLNPIPTARAHPPTPPTRGRGAHRVRGVIMHPAQNKMIFWASAQKSHYCGGTLTHAATSGLLAGTGLRQVAERSVGIMAALRLAPQ